MWDEMPCYKAMYVWMPLLGRVVELELKEPDAAGDAAFNEGSRLEFFECIVNAFDLQVQWVVGMFDCEGYHFWITLTAQPFFGCLGYDHPRHVAAYGTPPKLAPGRFDAKFAGCFRLDELSMGAALLQPGRKFSAETAVHGSINF